MFRPNMGIRLLILLTLVFWANSQKVNETCCFEDWDPEAGRVFQIFSRNGKNFNAAPFQTELQRWKANMSKYYVDEEPEAICRGLLNMNCNKGTKKCECSQMDPPFKYVMDKGGYCVGGKDTFCVSEVNAVRCKNHFFKCIPNPAWNNKFEYCKLDANAPAGAEDWTEWENEMYTSEGGNFKKVNMKGEGTRTQSLSFRILIFISALSFTLVKSIFHPMY